jgi:FkbM family methyltransferase
VSLHVTSGPDPAFTSVQRKFLDRAFECGALLAEAAVRLGGLRTFVQIGANDGAHDDTLTPLIKRYGLRGVLVEPQPAAAASLRALHAAHAGVTVAEVAVAAERGELTLWRLVGPERVGKLKLDAVTSFDRGHLEKHRRQSGADLTIESFSVPAMPLAEILREHELGKPDMVFIDTEGMDRVILDQVDLSAEGPAFIQFEFSNLKSEDLRHCHRRLLEQGYRFTLTNRDAICIHPSLVAKMVG